MFETSQTLAELATALALAQGELTDANKTSTNPGFKSKYADLAEVLQTVRPVLSKHGLSVSQAPGSYSKEKGTVEVTTILLHKSGEYLRTTLDVVVSKPDAQGEGGAITYGRRYSLAAIVGVAQDDEDGNTASGRTEGGATKAKVKAKSETPPPTMTVEELVKAFETVDAEGLPKLAPAFAQVSAEDQAKVLPAVRAARKRLGMD